MDGRTPGFPSLPEGLRAWYLLARSEEVRRGEVVSRELLGRPLALFRGESGMVYALSAHCSHMGAHLGNGKVVGDRLRCALHHWEYDGQGVCRRIPVTEAIPERACQRAFPTAERYGGIFVYNGAEAQAALPAFAAEEATLRTMHCPVVRLRCPWYAVIANAYDIQHLEAVHDRVLREPPVLEELPGGRMRLRYVSRVTGTTAADRVMRALSRDHIRVTITTWGGSLLSVESDLGRARSSLLLGMLPTPEGGTDVTPIVAVRRTGVGPLDTLRARVARWLFSGFLYRDVAIMDGMRFRPHLCLPHDEVLGRFLAYLGRLPAAGEPERPASLVAFG